MSNAIYKKDLHDIALAVAQSSKDYTDKKAQEILWKIGEYDITTQNDNTTALVKTAPSGATRVKIKRVYGNSVKYAPSTAYNDNVASFKAIPTNTYKANFSYIGGYSKENENLLVLSNVAETTINGITYKVENGVLNVRGTATSGGVIYIFNNKAITTGTSYVVKMFVSGSVSTSGTYRVQLKNTVDDSYLNALNTTVELARTNGQNGTWYFALLYSEGDVFTNYTIKPMLVSGSTAPTTYQPYFEGIRDSKTTSVVVSGNLLNIADVAETTVNGITYKIENGAVTLISGTATSGTRIANTSINVVSGMSLGAFNSVGMNGLTVQLRNNEVWVEDIYLNAINKTGTFTNSGNSINIGIASGTTISSPITIKPMLVKGSTPPSTYKPYQAPITKQIPAEILANEYYGLGYDDTHYNKLDLINKNIEADYKKIIINENTNFTLSITTSGKNRVIISASELKSEGNAKCDKLPYVKRSSAGQNIPYYDYESIEINGGNIIFYCNAIAEMTMAQITTWLASNNITLLAELNNTQTIDISSLLPTDFNKIATNDNYTNIEFVSEYGYDMPNKISFYGTIKETLCTAINKNDVLAVSLTNNVAKYGWSVNDIYNTRDYTTNKGSQKVARVKAKDLTWSKYGNNFYGTITDGKHYTTNVISVLCSLYNAIAWINRSNAQDLDMWEGFDVNAIIIKDTRYNDTTSFKNHFTDDDYIYYELATEVVEDITPLDNNVIEAVENDELGFVNSENQAVPSEITYRIEVEK